MKKHFKIDTRTLINIWNKTIDGKSKKNDWRIFVISVFKAVKEDNIGYGANYKDYSGISHAITISASSKHTDDEIYGFLSERLYTRLMGLRKKLIAARPDAKDHFAMPKGYKTRKGSSTSTSRMSVDEMIEIMISKA